MSPYNRVYPFGDASSELFDGTAVTVLMFLEEYMTRGLLPTSLRFNVWQTYWSLRCNTRSNREERARFFRGLRPWTLVSIEYPETAKGTLTKVTTEHDQILTGAIDAVADSQELAIYKLVVTRRGTADYRQKLVEELRSRAAESSLRYITIAEYDENVASVQWLLANDFVVGPLTKLQSARFGRLQSPSERTYFRFLATYTDETRAELFRELEESRVVVAPAKRAILRAKRTPPIAVATSANPFAAMLANHIQERDDEEASTDDESEGVVG